MDGASGRAYARTPTGHDDEEDPMASRLNPYLSFDGTALQAMEHYRDVLGGTLVTNTFGEYGMTGPGADQIMHAQLETESGFTLMAADVVPGTEHRPGNNLTISLSGDDRDALRGWFERLAEGGEVTVPLERQVWGDEFGQLVDRFGIGWLVNIADKQDA